jgi:hypothetical protein
LVTELLQKAVLFEREFGYAACYNINDSVLARVWYAGFIGFVSKAARLLNYYFASESETTIERLKKGHKILSR